MPRARGHQVGALAAHSLRISLIFANVLGNNTAVMRVGLLTPSALLCATLLLLSLLSYFFKSLLCAL